MGKIDDDEKLAQEFEMLKIVHNTDSCEWQIVYRNFCEIFQSEVGSDQGLRKLKKKIFFVTKGSNFTVDSFLNKLYTRWAFREFPSRLLIFDVAEFSLCLLCLKIPSTATERKVERRKTKALERKRTFFSRLILTRINFFRFCFVFQKFYTKKRKFAIKQQKKLFPC